MTSVAPGAENRSVIWVLIAALWLAASRSSRASRLPIRRAGSTNTGSSTSASRVICQEMPSITTSVSDQRDEVADDAGEGVAEGALGADDVVVEPADQRAGAGAGEERDRHPLHVVEDRRAQVEDQPLADAWPTASGCSSPSPASTTAITAISTASRDARPASAPSTMASTTRPASTGVATASTARHHAQHAGTASCAPVRPGERRDPAQRRPGERPPSSCAVIAWYSEFHAVTSMLMARPPRHEPAT